MTKRVPYTHIIVNLYTTSKQKGAYSALFLI